VKKKAGVVPTRRGELKKARRTSRLAWFVTQRKKSRWPFQQILATLLHQRSLSTPPMARFVLAAALAVTITLLVSATTAPLSVSDSLVPISPWSELFPFSADQVGAAMKSTDLPAMPTPTSIGESHLAGLVSANRKMTNAEAKERHAILAEFWSSAFPTIPLQSFQDWATPLYQSYIASLGLSSTISHIGQEGYHRRVLLGMSAVQVLTESGNLNWFSILDPIETRFYTGLANRHRGAGQKTPNKGGNRRLHGVDEDEVRRQLQSLPSSYDMRSVGLPPIRNQEQCGSCWAFTTSSTLEIQNLFANGGSDIGELSEQELVSCDTSNAGCNGGAPEYAWNWIKAKGGLTSRAIYPYENYYSSSVKTKKCQKSLISRQVANADGQTVYLPTASPTSSSAVVLQAEVAIMIQVYAGNPVTIQIGASSACFQQYSGAPTGSSMMTCSCGGKIDHVILVVGWTPEYFIARNQWGTSWGINGYAYLPRTSSNPTMPKNGICQMYSGPMYLTSVVALTGETRSPTPPTAPTTHSPVSPVSSAPTTTAHPSIPATCPSKDPLYCGAGIAQPCCPWLCHGGSCTDYVCCSNGVCAQLQVYRKKVYVVCPSSSGRRVLMGEAGQQHSELGQGKVFVL